MDRLTLATDPEVVQLAARHMVDWTLLGLVVAWWIGPAQTAAATP